MDRSNELLLLPAAETKVHVYGPVRLGRQVQYYWHVDSGAHQREAACKGGRVFAAPLVWHAQPPLMCTVPPLGYKFFHLLSIYVSHTWDLISRFMALHGSLA